MLTRIGVRDFAIIDRVELELDGGLTVLTGETGAGKSILVDALGLVLGDRADASAVRHGAARAEITAELDLGDQPEVARWLADNDLDEDGECLLRRVISREGRSRAYINGAPATLQTLKELGRRLVDIHGQHEHQSLGRRTVQRQLVDGHGGHDDLLETMATAWAAWRDSRAELDALRRAQEDREQRLELLSYQVRELDALNVEPGEADELATEHSRLANAGRLAEGASESLSAIYESDTGSAQQQVGLAMERLQRLADIDPALSEPLNLLVQAEIQLGEAADGLRHYLQDLDADPGRLNQVERRLGAMQDLARKHGIDAADLPAKLDELRGQLDALENAGATLESLEARTTELEAACREHASALTAARTRAAGDLSERVTALMNQLGMPGGGFEVSVAPAADDAPTAVGVDTVEFRVTTNPGQPAAPLAKIASGGELARISLAIQVVVSRGTIPCMVFDEVDSGVGGGVAEIVGKRLRDLGESRQVLCVTHLPQVACQGHAHLRVSKITDGDTTRTTLVPLDAAARVEELARMLGGVEITETTRAHAREMLEAGSGQRAAG